MFSKHPYGAVIVLLAGNSAVYAQGTISMSDSADIQVFKPQPLASSTTQVTYGGYTGYEAVGSAGSVGGYSNPGPSPVFVNPVPVGVGYDLMLLAGFGPNLPQSALIPVAGSLVSTWQPDGSWTSGTTVSIPYVSPGATASVAVAVWQAFGPQGQAQSLTQAQAFGYTWGISPEANVTLTGGAGFPVTLPSSIGDFSLATNVSQVPEPASIALLMTGGALALRRIKKRE